MERRRRTNIKTDDCGSSEWYLTNPVDSMNVNGAERLFKLQAAHTEQIYVSHSGKLPKLLRSKMVFTACSILLTTFLVVS